MKKIIAVFSLLIIPCFFFSGDIFAQTLPAAPANIKDSAVLAELLLQEGSLAFKNNDARKAISLIRQSIELDPRNAESYYRLGLIYVHEKEADKAIEYFKKTIAINPAFTKAYINLGSTLGQIKRYPEAMQFLQRALPMEEDNPKIYYNIGLIFMATGKKEAANKFFAQAKELALAARNTRLLEEIEKVYKY